MLQSIEQLEEFSTIALFSAVAVYSIAFVFYAVDLANRSGQAAVAAPSKSRGSALPRSRALRIGFSLTVLGFIFHFAATVLRGLAAERLPFANMYEFALTATVAVVGIYLLAQFFVDLRFLGALITGITVLFLTLTKINFYVAVVPLPPALDSYWLIIHILVAVLSVGFFTLSFGLSILQLLQTRRSNLLKASAAEARGAEASAARAQVSDDARAARANVAAAKVADATVSAPAAGSTVTAPVARSAVGASAVAESVVGSAAAATVAAPTVSGPAAEPTTAKPIATEPDAPTGAKTRGSESVQTMRFMSTFPSDTRLEDLSYRMAIIGFVFWTFTLIAGSIWAEAAWSRYWGWDTKEVWTFVIWVLYAGFIHARATRGWRGTRSAWLSIVAYTAVIFNFSIVNVFFKGLHAYSGL